MKHSNQMSEFTTDVLVVGAGPAGLTAAALLARQGTSSITITKYRDTANGPRAHITNQRTIEVMRDLGLESQVYDVGDQMEDVPYLVFVTSLAGHELGRSYSWGTRPDRKGDYEASSPCITTNISQHFLEPILLRGALKNGADVRFSTELRTIVQDSDGVTANVLYRPEGYTYSIRARYVIGADGGRSVVANQLGFEFDGLGKLGHALNAYVEADLTHLVANRPGTLYWTNFPGREYFFGSGAFALVRKWNEWMVQFSYDPENDDFDAREEVVIQRVRAAIGDPKVEVKVKNLGKWELMSLVAKQYRKGRVFIAGDAAHRHVPANGLGSNTSIQDAYNLAWKLSAVVRGDANETLLESYEAERLPVGQQIVARATKSMGLVAAVASSLGIRTGQTVDEGWAAIDRFFASTHEGSARRAELHTALDNLRYGHHCHGVEMNQQYVSGAVLDDGTPFPAHNQDSELYYQLTSHPGSYLPHAWLVQGGIRISSLDLIQADTWALITGVGGDPWLDAARQLEVEVGFKIASVAVGLGRDVSDPYGDWERLREITDRGALLVRPDKYIAWRAFDLSPDPRADLRRSLNAILHGGAEN